LRFLVGVAERVIGYDVYDDRLFVARRIVRCRVAEAGNDR
jgi:hypothetical protein